jgi:hypothetical protein
MDAAVVCYDEERPPGARFGRENPLPLLHSFFEFNEARRTGRPVTFVAEGPEAGRAMGVVKELLARPTNPKEAMLEMFAGRPVSAPMRPGPRTVVEQWRAWGWHGLADAHEKGRR